MDNSATPNHRDFGKMEYGCEHYRRRCKIRAPCCNQVFSCRHCHNEAASLLSNPNDQHEIVRRDVKQVICLVCETEQEVARVCSTCGVIMGEYFCGVCKFYDDDVTKKQFHCEECGICRVGGRENYFHCGTCGSCYPLNLHDNHSCLTNSMKNCCPICYEYLFESLKVAHVLKCGHTMHMDCLLEMDQRNQFRCPMCMKSMFDMSTDWEFYDREIEAIEMPEEYRFEVTIHCNDCNKTSKPFFHIVGHKCGHCNSYNTRRINEPDPQQ